MPTLDVNYGKDLKALIFDLDEKACKQALFGMVEILTQHPSILRNVFMELVSDGRDYHKARTASQA
jgi:hypothetical protein